VIIEGGENRMCGNEKEALTKINHGVVTLVAAVEADPEVYGLGITAMTKLDVCAQHCYHYDCKTFVMLANDTCITYSGVCNATDTAVEGANIYKIADGDASHPCEWLPEVCGNETLTIVTDFKVSETDDTGYRFAIDDFVDFEGVMSLFIPLKHINLTASEDDVTGAVDADGALIQVAAGAAHADDQSYKMDNWRIQSLFDLSPDDTDCKIIAYKAYEDPAGGTPVKAGT
jgi:hypothetical protein